MKITISYVTACLIAIVFCCNVMAAADAVFDKPNVLVIITDEHNFRTLGCYREQMPREQAEMWGRNVIVPTPNIDAIAHSGVLCTRAYATSPVCSPCRAAMITGRYPQATGVPANDEVLDRTIPTLADRLNTAGFRTGFIGKWHLGGTAKPEWAPKVDGGFQFTKFMFNRGHWKKFVMDGDQPKVGAIQKGKPSYNVDGADETSFSTDFLTDRAIEFMTDASAGKQPFLTVLSLPDPHGPNTVRAPYDTRFAKLPFEKPKTFGLGIPAPGWLGAGDKHPAFKGAEMARYFGMVQCIDDNIGKLVASLTASGQMQNTLVVFTSDHGDLCYEHDRLNKGNPYEGSARVPMILSYPTQIAAGQVYSEPVGTVDVTPTIIGMLGLPANAEDHGRDLSSILKNVSAAPTTVARQPLTFLRNAGKTAGWVAAVDSRYKLILSVNDEPWLFDKEQDPDEVLNFWRRPGTKEASVRLGKALREYGVSKNDPHLKNARIAESLAEVLSDETSN
ncbi:MAG: sulfatase [Fuerstiella sp.]